MSAKAFLFFIILSFAIGLSARCQFTPYSLYTNSPVLTQVAYPGSNDETEIWINYRQSRVANYNSPSLSLSHPLFNQSGRRFGGVGASVINESWANGLYRSTGLVAGFAYVLPISRQHSLSMGLHGGLISNGLNDSKVTTSSQYQLGAYNPGLASGEQLAGLKETLPLINAGFLWHWRNQNGAPKGHLGVSAAGMNRPKRTLLPTGARMPVAYTISGAITAWEQGHWSIRPTFRYVYQNTSLANIGMTAHYTLTKKTTLGTGAWYKTNKSTTFMLQVDHGTLVLAAGFDVTTGQVASTVNNAFELSLGWKLKRKKQHAQAAKPAEPEAEPSTAPAPEVAVQQPAPATTTTPQRHPVDTLHSTAPWTATPSATALTPGEKEQFDRPLPFTRGETQLTAEEEAHVRDLAVLMRTHPQYTLTITGHTCTTGGKPVNERISLERAEAVKVIFVQQGVDAVRITTVGRDFQEPVASNGTEEGRIKNRRVEIRLGQ
jgi:type IX secretion system PorP/SprF family membrane protein